MKLNFREYGTSGRPVIILHGLFGSSKNWATIAKELSPTNQVYCLDLRNHGDSPHALSHNLRDMADDVYEFIVDNSISNPILIGHSMGGLVTILFSFLHPNKIYFPIIVDIAPMNYPLDYEKEFSCLKMDVSGYSSRESIDSDMMEILPDHFIRQFLQMNLERTENGYRWKVNVPVLEKSRDAFELKLGDGEFYSGKAIFILGSESDYMKRENYPIIKKYFPESEIEIIKGAGHYLHHTHQKEFIKILKNSIQG